MAPFDIKQTTIWRSAISARRAQNRAERCRRRASSCTSLGPVAASPRMAASPRNPGSWASLPTSFHAVAAMLQKVCIFLPFWFKSFIRRSGGNVSRLKGLGCRGEGKSKWKYESRCSAPRYIKCFRPLAHGRDLFPSFSRFGCPRFLPGCGSPGPTLSCPSVCMSACSLATSIFIICPGDKSFSQAIQLGWAGEQ